MCCPTPLLFAAVLSLRARPQNPILPRADLSDQRPLRASRVQYTELQQPKTQSGSEWQDITGFPLAEA
jgi:hypothetical protein